MDAIMIGMTQFENNPADTIVDKESAIQLSDDADTGYIIEVDLEYPQDVHDAHSGYPLAPGKRAIPFEWLSSHQLSLLESIERANLVTDGKNFIGPIKPTPSLNEKLVPNLKDKSNYIVHYRNLKLYLQLGMKLEKIHRVLAFHQAPWLKPFIDFNTAQHAAATSEFAKDFFKLLNNACFGKTIENVREYRRVDLITIWKQVKKLAAKPTFRSFKRFHQNLLAVERYKCIVHLKMSIYTSFCVLDLSKLLMYDFHYNRIK